MSTALAVEDVHTYYGESHILHGVTLEVEEGKVTAILGRNGVGKTTLIRSIVGFTKPRQGRVIFRNQEVQKLPSHRICQLGIGLVPQGRRIFPSLSVQEQLLLGAQRKGAWTLERVYRLFPRLAERKQNLGSMLSGGEQSMLSVGRALMTNPDLLLMDEPSEGLAPVIIQELERTFTELKGTGLTVVLVEQNLHMALNLADVVYVMSKGQVVYKGSAQELAADAKLRQQHLGV
jgi:branched-chain amino acid transport system ATP-binding protein